MKVHEPASSFGGGHCCACAGVCFHINPGIALCAMHQDEMRARASMPPPLPERANREDDSQPLPVVNDAPDVQSAVIADIERRREIGIKRYGTALQPNNGRNALLDLYEELLDAAMYVKQRLIEEGEAR